jgi:prepilin-type N-terminal cleavage/methylation domain-containing protein
MICAPSKQKSAVSSPLSRLRCAPARQAVVRGNALQRFPVRRSLSTRHSFTRRLVGEGGNVLTLQRCNAFTLIELLVVMGIIAILMVLIAPAFTTIKGGTDVTSAAYTIKGAFDTARTYAKANNTYTWIGFYEEDVSQPSTNPSTPGTGRLVMSIVASKDGTTAYDPNSQTNPDPIAPTKLTQVGKLVKIDNVHLPLFAIGSGTGETFDTRPGLQNDGIAGYNYSRFGEINAGPNAAPYTNSQFPFWYPLSATSQSQAQYYFLKTLQFGPTGECRINSTYDVRRVIEVGLLQTHGSVAPTPSPPPDQYPGNVIAVQITGFGGNVKIYQR